MTDFAITGHSAVAIQKADVISRKCIDSNGCRSYSVSRLNLSRVDSLSRVYRATPNLERKLERMFSGRVTMRIMEPATKGGWQ